MPALSPTMKKGKITKWNYKVGDKIEAGDILAEIETDKSSVGFEMQDEGYIAKLLVGESSDVEVGMVQSSYVSQSLLWCLRRMMWPNSLITLKDKALEKAKKLKKKALVL